MTYLARSDQGLSDGLAAEALRVFFAHVAFVVDRHHHDVATSSSTLVLAIVGAGSALLAKQLVISVLH